MLHTISYLQSFFWFACSNNTNWAKRQRISGQIELIEATIRGVLNGASGGVM